MPTRSSRSSRSCAWRRWSIRCTRWWPSSRSATCRPRPRARASGRPRPLVRDRPDRPGRPVQNGKVRRSSAAIALLLYGTVLGLWAASRLAPLQPPPLRSLADGSLPAAALAVAASALGTVALFVPVGALAVAIVRGAASAGPLRALLAE